MTDQPPPAPDKRGNSNRAWWIIGALIAIAVLIQVTGVVGSVDSDQGGPSDVEAFTMCQQSVADKLVAPATANWPAPSQADISNTGSSWHIETYVDAQNSFGTQVRTDVSCDLTYEGDGSWLVSSTLD